MIALGEEHEFPTRQGHLDRASSGNRTPLSLGAAVALCVACGSGGSSTPTDPTSHSRLADVAAGVAQAAAAVTGQTAPMADNYEKGTLRRLRHAHLSRHEHDADVEEHAGVAVLLGRLLPAVALPRRQIVDGQARHAPGDGLGRRRRVRRPADVGQDAAGADAGAARGGAQEERLLARIS